MTLEAYVPLLSVNATSVGEFPSLSIEASARAASFVNAGLIKSRNCVMPVSGALMRVMWYACGVTSFGSGLCHPSSVILAAAASCRVA